MENKLRSPEWSYIPPGETSYKIILFDDGCQEYKQFTNNWRKFGKWRGKVALYNIEDQSIIIQSISDWKIQLTNTTDL